MIEFLPTREVAVIIGSWPVRWYGILYVAAFWLAWWLSPRLQKYRALSLTRDQWTYLLAWAAAGVLIGGRLGYVLFYEPVFYWQHPLDTFWLGQGGMSSHGGFIGVGLALWWVSRRLSVNIWSLLDVAAVPAALGLALGRVGNFINQELYTNHWYPIGKDLLLAAVCLVLLKRTQRPGIVIAIFLILYSILRWITEYWREPIDVWAGGLTPGQILTIPLFLAGVFLLVKTQKLKGQKQN